MGHLATERPLTNENRYSNSNIKLGTARSFTRSLHEVLNQKFTNLFFIFYFKTLRFKYFDQIF